MGRIRTVPSLRLLLRARWTRHAASIIIAAPLLASVAVGCGDGVSQRRVVVPDVTHTDIVGAFDNLRANGLRVTVPELAYLTDEQIPVARKQSPAAGTDVPGGTTVTLSRLAPGPLGSPGFVVPVRARRLPNLVGKAVSSALQSLQGTNVFWAINRLPGLTNSTARHLLDAYLIMSQRPAPGTLIPATAKGAIPKRLQLRLGVRNR